MEKCISVSICELTVSASVKANETQSSGLGDSRACPSNRFIGRWMACHCRIIPCECFTQSFSDTDCQSLHLGTPITALLSDGAAFIFSQPEEVMRCELGCFHTQPESESWFQALNFLTFASSILTLAACVYHCIYVMILEKASVLLLPFRFTTKTLRAALLTQLI